MISRLDGLEGPGGTMRAFVTGGSGFVGGHLIRRLVTDGHEVVALSRSRDAARRVAALGAVSADGDLSDAAAIAAAIDGAEVVFHCAALVGSHIDAALARATNVIGTANVVEASRRAGVRRLIHLSTESVLIDGNELDGVDESLPIPQRGHLSEYARTKAEAELIVLDASDEDLETIAIRPRLVWGPDDQTWLPGLIEKVESGVFRWVDRGVHPGSTCHVFNLVEAMILAVDAGTPGQAYFVTDGPSRSFKEFATAYLATAGVDPGDRSAPGWLMRGAGAALEFAWRVLPLRGAPPLNRVEAYMVSHPQVFDDTRARRELGYRPVIGFDEGIARLTEQ
jgi:nucleoside-diphosphate-sugar epimerase